MGQDEGEDQEGGALAEHLFRARQALDREREGAPEQVAELLARPPREQPQRLAADPRLQTWGVAERLLTCSQERLAAAAPRTYRPKAPPAPARPADLAELAEDAARLARLVLIVADLLTGRHPAALLEDLRARAWASIGEACLAGDDLEGATQALRSAANALRHGTGDLLIDARLLEFEAAVLSRQARPGESLALLKQAAARYRRVNEPDHLARVLARREELETEERPADPASHLAFQKLG
ncbi:MAG TPA: hypothetical protein VMM92_02870 [Thermoanaerobaculia bacterium]|nr:hypothetical protein [Thermoanaerobaculia bacterium]